MNDQKDIILDRILIKLKNEAEYIDAIVYKNKINYNDLLNIWIEYVKKYFLKINNTSIYKGSYCDNLMLYLSINEPELTYVFDKLLLYHLISIGEDLIIIYINGSDKALYLLKSYHPLKTSDKIDIPYWFHYIKVNDKIKKFYKEEFKDNSIIIRCY